MNSGGNSKLENRIRVARKRLNLEHKQIACLLGHKSSDQISRFENDGRLPLLPNALKLEIILGMPLRWLFPELYDRLRTEIKARAENNRSIKVLITDTFVNGLCRHEELLAAPDLSVEEFERARSHSVEMVHKISARWNEYSKKVGKDGGLGEEIQA